MTQRPRSGRGPRSIEPEPLVPTITELRVATYTRRSTDEINQPYTIQAQESKLAGFIKSQESWRHAASYTDDASGAKLERPNLDRLRRDARAGLFDVVLVYRVDRFSRSIGDLDSLIRELTAAGVAFRSATEPFDTTTAAGTMMVQMLGVFAQFERQLIIDRVINGMENKAKNGRWTLSHTPFGYTVDPTTQTLMPVPAEAAIVEMIFNLYTVRRMGTRNIATHLNAHGLSTRSNRPWSYKTITDALTNRAYIGDVVFRTITTPAAHPPIIPAETFDLADAILWDRGENPARKAGAAYDYHLTGKLLCPLCGCRYLGTAATGKTRTYRYYTCFTRNRYGPTKCAAPRIDADRLDDLALKAIREFYTERTYVIGEAIAQAQIDYRAQLDSYRTELATINTRIAEREATIDSYLSNFEQNKITQEAVAIRVNRLTVELTAMRDRCYELDALIATQPQEPDPAILVATRDRVNEIINDGTVPERKAMCDALLEEVRLDLTGTATPIFRVPFNSAGNPLLTALALADIQGEGRVRERRPSVELARRYSSHPNLRKTLQIALDRTSQVHQTGPRPPRPRTHKLSQRLDASVAARLTADYAAGLSSNDLMAKYCLGKGPVLKLLHEQGVTLRRIAIDSTEVERAVQLYGHGWSCVRIAAEINRRPSTVWSMLSRAGVKLRDAHDRS